MRRHGRGALPPRARAGQPGARRTHALVIRVAVSGASGRMGATVCGAVEGADDMELSGRADPELGTSLEDVLDDAEVVVDFTTPDAAPGNIRACLDAGVHCVVGTT